MDLLLQAPIHIQFHVLCAVYALLIGPVAIFRPRRDRLHRWLGYSWVIALALTALSSFFIFGFRIWGPFSPIHLLSILTLFGSLRGVSLIRQGRRVEHAQQMQSLYFLALGIPGVFTLLPALAQSSDISRFCGLGFCPWRGTFSNRSIDLAPIWANVTDQITPRALLKARAL